PPACAPPLSLHDALPILNGRSGQRMGQGVSGNIVSSDLIHWSWYLPYGMLTPGSWIAMIAHKYMHKYGVTAEDLGRVAISQRNRSEEHTSELQSRFDLVC